MLDSKANNFALAHKNVFIPQPSHKECERFNSQTGGGFQAPPSPGPPKSGWPQCALGAVPWGPLSVMPSPRQNPARLRLRPDVCETRPCSSDGHHQGVGLGGASPLAPPPAERPRLFLNHRLRLVGRRGSGRLLMGTGLPAAVVECSGTDSGDVAQPCEGAETR